MHSSLADTVLFGAETDELTLVRAAQEDPAGFEPLYERYRDRIYWYLRSRTRDEEDTTDLLQQVFLQAMDRLSQYRPNRGPFVAWLFAIARNTAISFHRGRRPTVTWDLVPEALQLKSELDLDAATERREAMSRLRDALLTLLPEQRQLLALRFAGRLSAAEIAAVIGKSEAATRKQLWRTETIWWKTSTPRPTSSRL